MPSWLGRWAPQLHHEIAQIYPQCLGDLEDLDEVEPSLPAFVLGDERLWSAEPLSELDLSQALGMPAGDQPIAKPSIGRTEDGPGHSCCHAIVAATLIRGWDYPNMGYHQCLDRAQACASGGHSGFTGARRGRDMADLEIALTSVRDRIVRYRGESIGEENTKNVLIEPVLRALGWDVEELDEVRREYRRRPGDLPVDYALFLLRTPRLFVEAKALGENLADHKSVNQLLGYASVAGCEWAVLTDGNEYRIYNANAAGPEEEKLFRRITIASGDWRRARLWLSYRRVSSRRTRSRFCGAPTPWTAT